MHFELLDKHHNRKGFDCGNQAINDYFHKMANQHAKKGIARTHLLMNGQVIVGFYTLSNTIIENTDKEIGSYPNKIPAILIGRMGVDLSYQGKGMSEVLLSHAIGKIKKLSFETGIAFIVIEAKTHKLADYYQGFGFEPFPNSPLRLFLAVNEID